MKIRELLFLVPAVAGILLSAGSCNTDLLDAVSSDVDAYLYPADIQVSVSSGTFDSNGSYTFVDMWIGESASPVTFSVQNTGRENLVISNFYVTGDIGNFSYSFPSGEVILGEGESCTLEAAFSPSTVGEKNLNIRIDSSSEEDVSFNLTGYGLFRTFVADHRVRSSALDSGGNLYIVGGEEGANGYDWFVKKFAPNGTEITGGWDKQIDGNGRDDFAWDVIVDDDNYVYITGYGSDLITDVGVNIQEDWWIKKFQSDGTEVTTNWNKIYNGADDLTDKAWTISAGRGNVLVAGLETFSGGNYFWRIQKYYTNGNTDPLWNDKSVPGIFSYAPDSFYMKSPFSDSEFDRFILGGASANGFTLYNYKLDGTLEWSDSVNLPGTLNGFRALAYYYYSTIFTVSFYNDAELNTHTMLHRFGISTGNPVAVKDYSYNEGDTGFDYQAQTVTVTDEHSIFLGGSLAGCWYLKNVDYYGEDEDAGGSGLQQGWVNDEFWTTNGRDVVFPVDGNIFSIKEDTVNNRIWLVGERSMRIGSETVWGTEIREYRE